MSVRIAIPVPTSADLAYNDRNWGAYADAVRLSGAEPVKALLTMTPREIAELANRCQGILLPGSPADVTPEKYGQEIQAGTAPADLPRENMDELLLQDAHNLYKPILAVCFGMQMLNVWRAGTLVQDLQVMPVNHGAGPSVAVAHTAEVERGSVLAGIVGEGRLPMNSSHHQAVGIAGDGLRVVARCPQDGVVEAIEGGQVKSELGGHSEHFVVGVQWHPERSFATDEASRKLFGRFVAEAAAWKPRAVLTSVG